MRTAGICFVVMLAAWARGSSASVIAGVGPGSNSLLSPTLVTMDIDGDGVPDIAASASSQGGISFASVGAGAGPAPGSTLQFTDALTSGTVVSGALAFTGIGVGEHAEFHTMDPSLNQPGGTIDGDYGFRFTSGGATHYGWAHLFATAQLLPPSAQAGIVQWAYESQPNTSITVGAVPEPMSAALLLVGGPALLRRSRPRG